MKKTYLDRGFTLIELLVVIAIIGILSSIVLASLSTARGKGKDAAIEEQLSGARAQMEIYAGANGNSYGASGAACTTAASNNGIAGILAGVTTSGGGAVQGTLGAAQGTTGTIYCYSNAGGTAWEVQSPLSTAGQFWCVDNTGASKPETTGALASAVACI